MTSGSDNRIAYATLALSTILMGTAFTVSKYLVDAVPHQVAALLRFGLGGVVMAGCLAVAGGGIGISRRELQRVGFAGCFGIFGYNALFFWGLSLAPSVDGSVIVPILSPVITTTLAVVFLGDRASSPRVAGLALAVAGAVSFLLGSSTSASPHRLIGDLVYLAAAGSWSVYTLIGKRLLTGINPLKATTYATLCGSVLLAVLAAPELGSTRWSQMSPGAWLSIAYLVIGPTVIAYVFYYRGVKAVGPSTASLMLFLSPAVGAIGGSVFLGESLSWAQDLGSALMAAGALLAITQWRLRVPGEERVRAPRPAAKAPSEHLPTGKAGQ